MTRPSSTILGIAFCIALLACTNQTKDERASQNEIEQQSEKITLFWKWFKPREQKLFEMEPGDAQFQALSSEIKSIDEKIEFEIAPAPEGMKELAISAAGNEAVFPLVEATVNSAPELTKWRVVAFRQRVPAELLKDLEIAANKTGPDGKIDPTQKPFGVAVKDMRFTMVRVGKKVNLVIFIKDYKNDSEQEHLAMMMLQQAVGEYDLVKKIDSIEFKPLNDATAKDAKPFESLGDTLDKTLST